MAKSLKSKYGKYFTFKDTIDGTAYFLRGLIGGLLFAIPFGILLGVGAYLAASGSHILGIILILSSLLLLIPYLWFSLATTWKRLHAFWPNHATKLLIALFALSFLSQLLNPDYGLVDGYLLLLIFTIPQVIFSLYILFANSKVENHVG